MTNPGSPVDPAQRKERKRAIDRLHVATRQAGRLDTAADLAAIAAPWKRLGVPAGSLAALLATLRDLADAIRRAATDFPDAPLPLAAIVHLRDALAGDPADELPAAIRDLLWVIPCTDQDAVVRGLQSADLQLDDLEMVPDDVGAALRALREDDLTAIDASTFHHDLGQQWRRFADAALALSGRKPKNVARFFDAAPLPVVDAYLDKPQEPPRLGLWADRIPQEERYLTARTRPAALEDADLIALGWWDEYHRRRLAQGLPYELPPGIGPSELYSLLDQARAGDPSVLGRLAELLPAENAAVVRELVGSARSGKWPAAFYDWPAAFYDDHALWLLMARLLPANVVLAPKGVGFRRWAGLRRAYDMTVDGKLDEARAQVLAFGRPSAVLTPVQREIFNLKAYILSVGPPGEGFDEAINLLGRISKSPVAAANLELLRRRRDTGDGVARNPYFTLGVRHGAPAAEWRKAWRVIRTRHKDAADIVVQANKAKDLIEKLEREGSDGQGEVFVAPLDRESIAPLVTELSPLLMPGPQALPRRTTQQDLDAAMAALRSAALKELLPTLNTRVGRTSP